MAQYLPHPNVGTSPATFPPGADNCPEGGLVAFDMVDKACYSIVGLGAELGDIVTSIEGACNVFNLNVHRTGTFPAAPTIMSLKASGPVSV
jgi:hypothetical protein